MMIYVAAVSQGKEKRGFFKYGIATKYKTEYFGSRRKGEAETEAGGIVMFMYLFEVTSQDTLPKGISLWGRGV